MWMDAPLVEVGFAPNKVCCAFSTFLLRSFLDLEVEGKRVGKV
jgi:hypothetical protein